MYEKENFSDGDEYAEKQKSLPERLWGFAVDSLQELLVYVSLQFSLLKHNGKDSHFKTVEDTF